MLLRMGNKTAPPSACDFNFHHGFGNTMPECVSRKLLLTILTETKNCRYKAKLTMLPSDDEEESALATYTLFAVSPACAPRHMLLPMRIWEIIKCQGDRGRPGSWRLPVKRVPWRCKLWQRSPQEGDDVYTKRNLQVWSKHTMPCISGPTDL